MVIDVVAFFDSLPPEFRLGKPKEGAGMVACRLAAWQGKISLSLFFLLFLSLSFVEIATTVLTHFSALLE